MGIGLWTVCSVGMLVFNKLAITAFPVECTLVGLQMAAACVVVPIVGWRSLYIGSAADVLRWMKVVPFFVGMLLTSILALKHAPMSLTITFRAASPLVALAVEQFFPKPTRITMPMLGSVALMLVGCGLYTIGLEPSDFAGIGWVVLNNFFAIGDRLLQRLMLSSDQNPVDISKTSVTLLNNLLGMGPLLVVAFFMNEFSRVSSTFSSLDRLGALCVGMSCLVGIGISYTGIWVQSMISAASFLVLVNANKFAIIILEAFVMHTRVLPPVQIVGATLAVFAGIAYGKAKDLADQEDSKEAKEAKEAEGEAQALLKHKV